VVNIEYMAVSYALVGILVLGYIGVQHLRVNRLWSLIEEETASDNNISDDKIKEETE
jgi:hypothetical protein